MEKEEFIKELRKRAEERINQRNTENPENPIKFCERTWNETLMIFNECYPGMVEKTSNGIKTWDECLNDMLEYILEEKEEIISKEELIKRVREDVEKDIAWSNSRPDRNPKFGPIHFHEDSWKDTLEIIDKSYPDMVERVKQGKTSWKRCVNDMSYVYDML